MVSDDIAKRLRAIRERLRHSQARFAEAIGVSLATIRALETGRNLPGGQTLAKLIELGFSADWIFTGRGSAHFDDDGESGAPFDPYIDQIEALSAEVSIPRLELTAPTERGKLMLAQETKFLRIPKDILRQIRLSERHASYLVASGESMRPIIADGDPLIIERGVESIVDGHIYVFTINDAVHIKRLVLGPNHLIMVSDNPDWPMREQPIPADAPFSLIGRVRWVGRTL